MFYDFISKYTDIFVEETIATKASHIFFFNKNIGIFEILTFEIFTKRYLTTSLALNNRALILSCGLLKGNIVEIGIRHRSKLSSFR